jgi:hypothetical protein
MNDIGKNFLGFLVFFGFATTGICQDTLKSKEIDKIANQKRNRFVDRRDIIGDTIIFYLYDSKTNDLYKITEYAKLRKNRTTYHYDFFDGQLKRVTVCYCWKVKKKRQAWIHYYFDQNELIHTEEHGMKADKPEYFLQRGNMFLKRSGERFLDTKY